MILINTLCAQSLPGAKTPFCKELLSTLNGIMSQLDSHLDNMKVGNPE